MGRANLAPPVTHALHDDNVDVVDGDVTEAVHDGLSAELAVEPKPSLPLECRWRLPLTRVHNLQRPVPRRCTVRVTVGEHTSTTFHCNILGVVIKDEIVK